MSDAPATDLDVCASEPIHIPGSIQPHGFLLIVDAVTMLVSQTAGEVAAKLGVGQPLGLHLRDVIGAKAAGTVTSFVQSGRVGSAFIGQITTTSGEVLDISAFRSGGVVGVELEPAAATAESALEVLGRLEAAVAAFERCASLETLCDQAAVLFRELTGFDRVMIYRFGENDAGRVLAEARRPDMHAFLNHHFPASDIPAQARALYVRNLVRVIPDAWYRPAPLHPSIATEAAIDLSDSNLRSVSPIHLKYLRNMRVRASASISIVRDGHLWGLVACHHETPCLLTYDVRAACRALAGGLARQIKGREEAESYRQRIRFRGVEDDVIHLLSCEGTLDEALGNHLPELLKMIDADGVAIVRGNELVASGAHPPINDVRGLTTWLAARSGDGVFASSTLADDYAAGIDFRECGSGVLSMILSVEEPWVLLWFRAEQVEVVNWAGDPHKAVVATPGASLSPRSSFETWKETVRGRSRPWALPEIESARRLRGSILDMRQTRRVRELNSQLTRLLQEQSQLVEQKDYLIGEVNHRVQNSLQLVSSFLMLQGRSSDSSQVRDALEEARRRLAAVALVHSRLYAGTDTRAVDGARYIEELCRDATKSMGHEWEKLVSLDLSPVLIPTDRAVTLGLVVTELFININKYAYGGGPGPIWVTLSEERSTFTLVVEDRGRGRTTTRRGFGSRMIDGLLSQMDGRLSYEDNNPGLKVSLTVKLARS